MSYSKMLGACSDSFNSLLAEYLGITAAIVYNHIAISRLDRIPIGYIEYSCPYFTKEEIKKSLDALSLNNLIFCEDDSVYIIKGGES